MFTGFYALGQEFIHIFFPLTSHGVVWLYTFMFLFSSIFFCFRSPNFG
jgi:hypothetical protein